MNKVIYLIFVLLVTINLSSCTKKFEELNTDPTQFINATPEALLAVSVKRTGDWVGATGLNNGINVNMWEIANFGSAVGRYANGDQGVWQNFYVNILQNINQIETQFGKDTLYKNRVQIARIWKAYVYSILTGYFGSIPLTEANNTNYLTEIKFESEDSAYIKILGILKTASTTINVNSTKDKLAYDVVYGNSSTQLQNWVKFANTLRMKLGMVLADVDASAAKSAVEASDAGAISAASDNGLFTYLSASPNQNPLHVDIVLGGRQDYIAAKDLMDKLLGWNDPRTGSYFSTNNGGKYAGGIVGKVNTYVDFSRAGAKVIAADAPYVLADYVETEFLRAEAKERGFNVAGTAEQHYNNAITASILYWGGTQADADAYLAQPDVAYTTAAGNWKQKIGTQKWIALYNRSFETWTELRRLDYPVITAPVNAKSGFPTRLTYPNTEQTLNGTAYTAAAAAIGGDVVTTKLFWDKN